MLSLGADREHPRGDVKVAVPGSNSLSFAVVGGDDLPVWVWHHGSRRWSSPGAHPNRRR